MFRPVLREPRALFLSQRNNAEARNIPWRFTFDEWWALWSPHWERRVLDKLCLCREGDAGEYALGNCRIDTAHSNLAEEFEVLRERRASRPPEPQEYSLPDAMRDIERGALIEALEASQWNQTRAAKRVGLTFRQMRYKVREFGLLDEQSTACAA